MVFVQGITPALMFGMLHSGGLFALAVAAIYALLAWGIWESKEWALISAIIFTLPQLFVVSTKLFSWQFFVGGAFGAGIAPSSSLLNTRIASYYSLGARFDLAFSERSQSLLSGYKSIGSENFVLLNVVAVIVLAILTTIFLKHRSKPAKT